MASAGNTGPTGQDAIQFDRAEFTTAPGGAVECSTCKQPIDREYYELHGHVVCGPCVQMFEAAYQGGPRLVRFLKASGFGVAAAVGAAIIIYLFREITGWEAAIISILAGYMVGSAVKQGSGNRGGRVYQVMAVFLTYSALSWSYLPLITKEVLAQVAKPLDEAKPDQAAAGKADAAGAKPASKPDGKPLPNADKAKAASPAPLPDAAEKPKQPVSVALVVLLLAGLVVFVVGFAYFAPVLSIVNELPQGLIGLLIVFWGLHQAWQMTHKVAPEFRGPFPVGGGGPSTPGAPAHV